MSRPLLILSDAPSSTTGLGRISRDLATRIHAHMPEFRVATLGYGGPGSAKLGFPQYNISSIDGWYVPELPGVWEDHAGNERGVLLTIWDPSRLRWLSRPDGLDWKGNPICPPLLKPFLKSRPFELWGYIPVDATGPNDKLTSIIGDALKGYDRIMAYSEWAARIIERTIEVEHVESLPHGIDTEAFKPHDRREAKRRFRGLGFQGLTDDSFLVGIVATNQARKDFGLGIEICAKLLQQGLDVRVWIHTDTIVRHWNILSLLEDFGLLGRVVISSNQLTDEEMSWRYSACDVTLGIGLGEGWGFPIFESLACGTPCVHGDYGGAAELMPEWMKTKVRGWRLEGQFNCKRPVFDPGDWAITATWDHTYGVGVKFPEDIAWSNLWPHWKEWLLR